MHKCASVNVMMGLNYYVFLFNSQASVFMGFSITSTVFGSIIIICYGISTAFSKEANALTVIILIMGIIESAIGIWAAVCLCLMKPCTCCATSSQQVSHPSVMRVLMPFGFLRLTVQ